MKNKVLIIGDNNLETVGGEQESTKIIIQNLRDDFDISVIQPGHLMNPVQGVKYERIASKDRIKKIIKNPISFIGYVISVYKSIKHIQPNIIHTQAQVSFFIIGLLTSMKLINKEKVITIHTERGLYRKYNSFFRKLFLFFLKDTDYLITTTEFNKSDWENSLQKNSKFKGKVLVIENTAGDHFELFNEELKIQKEPYVIGFAGRYCDWKNWPLAIEIIKNIFQKSNENVYIRMAVGCLDEKARISTQEMFEELKLITQGKFKGEINLTLKEMDNFYYDLDFFILTSKVNTESFGRTLVEAMSRKAIVLSTNAGGTVEVVGNNNHILENANEFSNKVLFYIKNKEIMESEKLNGLNRVRNVYSLKNNIDKHRKLYRET